MNEFFEKVKRLAFGRPDTGPIIDDAVLGKIREARQQVQSVRSTLQRTREDFIADSLRSMHE